MTAGQTISFWMKNRELYDPGALNSDLTVDVCIIGSGITGLTSAYLLSKQGKTVAVLEDGLVTSGETLRTTAHLASALDDRYYNLEKLFGTEGAKLAAESHSSAIKFIEDLVEEEKIDCDFERINAYLFNDPDKSDILHKELEAAKKAGLDVNLIEQAPIKTFNTGPCLEFKNQAQFLPFSYIKTLCKLIEKNRGKIFTHTHADTIDEKDPICTVKTSKGYSVNAKDVIIATNSPINNRFFPHLKQASYRSYVITGKIPTDTLAKALYYDTADPYHYIRLVKGEALFNYLIVGGEDHRVGEEKNNAEKFMKLEKWIKDLLPSFERMDCQWSGQIIEPIDSLAFIGRSRKNSHVFIATGYSGNGLTHGTIAALLLSDLIFEKSNPWEELYNPHRITLSAAFEFCEENLNTACQYADWFSGSEIDNIVDIKPGTGAIVREGLKKIAVYCDKDGKLNKFSAVCPHLKGLVRWNNLENSWDCPCHGSRFNTNGEVINGPANGNLNPYEG